MQDRAGFCVENPHEQIHSSHAGPTGQRMKKLRLNELSADLGESFTCWTER